MYREVSLVRRLTAVIVGACAACLVASRPAAAASCSITATPTLAFGAYSVYGTAAVPVNGQLQFKCTTASVPYTVSLDKGGNASTFSPRYQKLAGGTDLLQYNVYTTSGHTTIWGDGTPGTATVSGTTAGANVAKSITLFGSIPAGQDVTGGNYGDTLTLTLSF